MHAGRLDRSPRLRRVHELLSDGHEHSTRDIREGAHIEAVSATVSELRDNGAEIQCRQDVNAAGQRIWLYRMTKSVESGKRGGQAARQRVHAPEIAGSTPAPATPDPAPRQLRLF